MVHGKRLMAHASMLMAQGPWRWVSQARALAPIFSGPWALSHEPWGMSHEPLTIINRLFNELFNSKVSKFEDPKILIL